MDAYKELVSMLWWRTPPADVTAEFGEDAEIYGFSLPFQDLALPGVVDEIPPDQVQKVVGDIYEERIGEAIREQLAGGEEFPWLLRFHLYEDPVAFWLLAVSQPALEKKYGSSRRDWETVGLKIDEERADAMLEDFREIEEALALADGWARRDLENEEMWLEIRDSLPGPERQDWRPGRRES